MRLLTFLLIVLLAALQYRLWFGQNSVADYFRQQDELRSQQASNLELEKRNRLLKADVTDLQQGLEAIEERARNELGLIRDDEVFFRMFSQRDIEGRDD
ncbi:MAG: cell division protein FtsB [Gammaproteobacteria bacterium]|nr:cell division protein FtsB [Gammaproteobacteria bacterium]MBU1555742.1 cell division protein FtsB [Gammaproteobacteria bacterium]MBU2071931.1 cell division protein FtsB [Gammaproteobacteria bacterium]MBU2181792.1 cell division protein FtsB [Gammaproteobacteria bacterium]MBU2206380.1 cell division protein FtsB [Gammaproteobacteria bacterium]